MSLLVLAVGVALAGNTPPKVSIGDTALAFSLPAVNEDTALQVVNKDSVALGDFAGLHPPVPRKVVLVHFFEQSSAGDDLGSLQRLQKRYRNDGLQVLAVSSDRTSPEYEAWLEAQRLSYPVLFDAFGVVQGRYGIKDPPLTIVVDAEGRIASIGKPTGTLLEEDIEKQILPLLE